MILHTNIKYLSEKKNPQWSKYAIKLVECYEKKDSKKIPHIMEDLNALFRNNNLPEIKKANYTTEYTDFIKSTLGVTVVNI